MDDDFLQLPPELLDASKQINEPESISEKKAAISAFLLQIQDHLEDGDVVPSEKDALKYLRLRKFRLDQAVATYANRLAFFREHAALLKDIQLQDFYELYADSFVRVLPGRDKQGRRLLCFRIRRPQRFQLEVVMLRWVVYCLDALSEDVYFQVNGLVIIQNLGEVKLMDALHLAGLFRKGGLPRVLYYIQECSPARVSNIFILKPPPFVSIVWNLFKMVLKPKLRERVRFCSQPGPLHEAVHPDVLPPLWGGTSEEDPWAWYKSQEQAKDE